VVDIGFIALAVGFFALCVAYVRGLDRIVRAGEGDKPAAEEPGR
jgi:hypothetical protein